MLLLWARETTIEHTHPCLQQRNIRAVDLHGGKPVQGAAGQTEHEQLQVGLMLGQVMVWGQQPFAVELPLDLG